MCVQMYPCICTYVSGYTRAFMYVRRPHGNHGSYQIWIGDWQQKKVLTGTGIEGFWTSHRIWADAKGELKSRGNLDEDVHTSTLCTMYKSKNWKRQQHRQILIRRNAHTHTHTGKHTGQTVRKGRQRGMTLGPVSAGLPACLRSYVRSADRRGRRTCTQQTNELVLLFCGMCVSRADEREWERG